MGKSKKRKDGSSNSTDKQQDASMTRDNNPLLTAQQNYLKSLPSTIKADFFSSKLTPEERAKVWEEQADLGESLVNSYSWATPDDRLLKVFQHFAPIVEVGCGANAYWARWMHDVGGVDVVAFDVSLEEGGKIAVGSGDGGKSKKKKNKGGSDANNNGRGGLTIRQGGPEVLSSDDEIRESNRALFLCYPDEEEYRPSPDNEEGEDMDDEAKTTSMAAACLDHYTGDTVIHVGELYGDTLSLDQAPWGRSSSNEFQERLAGEYHCILKMKLENNWLHVRDTLSVWKRSETCCMVFEEEGDQEEEEDGSADEVHYKHIPSDEVLPTDLAAPCVAHLLKNNNKALVKRTKGNEGSVAGEERKRKKKKTTSESKPSPNADSVIPGSAW